MLVSLVLSALLAAAASPAGTNVTFRGRVDVDLHPVWSASYADRRATVKVEPLASKTKESWRLSYTRDGKTCALEGTGPRDAIVLTPRQTCNFELSDRSYRGRVTVTLLSGKLWRDKAQERLDVEARIAAVGHHLAEITLLGRRFERWVPVIVPEGSGRFAGATAER